MGTTSGHEAGVEAQAFSEGHTSGGEVMLEAFQPQENGEALAPVGIDSFHSSEDDMFGLGGDDESGNIISYEEKSLPRRFFGKLFVAGTVLTTGFMGAVGGLMLSEWALSGGIGFLAVEGLTGAILGGALFGLLLVGGIIAGIALGFAISISIVE